jgi:hypothetical protein
MSIARYVCFVILLQFSLPSWAQEVMSTPDGAARLKRMHQYLMAQRDIELSSNIQVVNQALGATRNGTVTYILRKPNLLRVNARLGGNNIVAISDGKTLTVHEPSKRKYRSFDTDETNIGNLYKASGLLGREVRMIDFFWSVDYLATVGDRATLKKISARKFGSKTCDGYNIQYGEDDFSVWLERSDPFLPCHLVSKRKDGSGLTTQTNTMSWKTKPAIAKNTFEFSPPKGHTSE